MLSLSWLVVWLSGLRFVLSRTARLLSPASRGARTPPLAGPGSHIPSFPGGLPGVHGLSPRNSPPTLVPSSAAMSMASMASKLAAQAPGDADRLFLDSDLAEDEEVELLPFFRPLVLRVRLMTSLNGMASLSRSEINSCPHRCRPEPAPSLVQRSFTRRQTSTLREL